MRCQLEILALMPFLRPSSPRYAPQGLPAVTHGPPCLVRAEYRVLLSNPLREGGIRGRAASVGLPGGTSRFPQTLPPVRSADEPLPRLTRLHRPHPRASRVRGAPAR